MKIDAFEAGKPLMIIPYPNGGWVVEQPDGTSGVYPKDLGAYSSAADMIKALSAALLPLDEFHE